MKWKFNGFHTVTFPAKGKSRRPSSAPIRRREDAGVNDAAGKPFWFNGQPGSPHRDGALPAGGKSYNGKKLVSSGAPLAPGAPKPYTVKFTKKGATATTARSTRA